MDGTALWRTDGTSSGTYLVRDGGLGTNSKFTPRYMANVSGILYFVANDTSTGGELWRSDGTSSGTFLVRDIFPGTSSSGTRNLTNVNGTLFFVATSPETGTEVWRSDGTSSGTNAIELVPGTGSGGGNILNNVGAKLLYQAILPGFGNELFRLDGPNSTPVLVCDIVPGSGSSAVKLPLVVGNVLFFKCGLSVTGEELWRSDGTSDGTYLVKDIYPGSKSSAPQFFPGIVDRMVEMNGLVYFAADTPGADTELWRSDGTSAGTFMVRDLETTNRGGRSISSMSMACSISRVRKTRSRRGSNSFVRTALARAHSLSPTSVRATPTAIPIPAASSTLAASSSSWPTMEPLASSFGPATARAPVPGW